MDAPRYDPDSTMLDARTRYFELNGFGPDGGYSAAWVQVEIGSIPLRIPNTASRVRAVRYHDLHHIVTGYATDMKGESEISAWELASNCRDFYAAWVLNGAAFAYGLLVCPRRVRAAFIRGCHTRNLYDRDFNDALLGRTVAKLRAELALDDDTLEAPRPATTRDRLVFAVAAMLVLGVPIGLLAAVVAGLIAWLC
ncbi:hypothetical protein ENSA5_08940 [Enhygromyxa salina]|uniref:Uncharacterized protein n=1 Tax=Enhygromyxa salina TaxID=215803 RepID=A0A2S9YGK6_9BACT|nr:hypothetical protein [Enhygromyxa salina]PRQ04245.1 hypothetical protein ENSA5_08940 [Enhygromyxa salina]